jgi:hypothetical protein
MAGAKNGLTYFTNVLTPPLSSGIQPGHKAMFTMDPGVFVEDSSGNIVRLDDYGLIQDVSGSLTSITNYISGAVDLLGSRVTTLEISANNHEVRIDNIESSISTIDNSLAVIIQGNVICDTTHYVYNVTHPSINVATTSPIISLTVPSNASNLYISNITNRTANGFDVLLSSIPDVSGYTINWTMPLSGSAVVVRAYGVASSTIVATTFAPNAGTNDTFELNYSGACTVVAPISMADGQTINIIANGAVGSTLAWSGFLFGGGAPTATANGKDIFTILKKGSLYFVTYSLDFN